MGYIVVGSISMFTSLLFKGGVVLLLVTACLFFAWRIVRILNPRPPRPPKYTEYFVVEVKNGATIIVAKKIGKRKSRRTKSLNLEGGASPAEGEQWFAESRDNLILFAGAKVRVQVRGLFRSVQREMTDKEFAELEWGLWYLEHVKTCKRCIDDSGVGPPPLCEEAFDQLLEIFKRGSVEVDCWVCKGTGKLTYPAGNYGYIVHEKEYVDDCYRCGGSGQWWTHDAVAEKYRGEFYTWWNEHHKICGSCRKGIYCGEGGRRWEEYEKQQPQDFRPFVETPEIRDVVVGTVWGESGALLNLEQLKSGWAKSVGEVPEEWAEAEKEAKRAGTGIWSKP